MKTAFLFFMLALTSCASLEARQDIASELASSANLKPRDVKAGNFTLRTYERITSKDEVDIYIEGDGLAWLSRNEQSMNPTPTNPVGLRLAVADNSHNVVYLARPCQYVKLAAGCTPEYWGRKRYAPEVITAYMELLDGYGFAKINLIGYSGGAGIAAILAAKRPEVVSLRTVAGNVDIAAFSKLHDISRLEGSLNPADYSGELLNLPQIHFIGENDNVITPEISRKFLAGKCARAEVVKGLEHENGWAEIWPKLIRQAATCNN
jgi:hypothetical protein